MNLGVWVSTYLRSIDGSVLKLDVKWKKNEWTILKSVFCSFFASPQKKRPNRFDQGGS